MNSASDAVMAGAHILATIGFLLYMFFGVYKPLKLDPSTPGTLTTLGILGTFTGIFLGLLPFIMGTDDISKNVPHLISGIAVAAICSIAGMALALRSKGKQRDLRSRETKEEHTGATADTLANLLQILITQSETQNDNLLSIQKAIVGDEEGTLLTQLQKMRTSFSDKQDQLIKSFDSFAEKMAKSNSEALIDALKEVITDFNAKINEQFGDNFKQLNEAVGQLLVWQENYRTDVEELQKQFTRCLAGVKASEDSLSTITEKTNAIVQVGLRLEQLLVAYNEHREDLAKNLEAFASLSGDAQNAFPIIHQNIKHLTENFSTAVEAAVDDHKKMLERQQKVVGEMILNFQELETKTSQHTDKVFKAIEEQSTSLTTDLEKTMNQNAKRLEEQVIAIDKALEQELTKSLNSLGSQLTSLSSKFVSDYTPLTSKLEKLVQMSSGLGRNN